MKLEIGKFYKMRNGETVGPLLDDGNGVYMAKKPVGEFMPMWLAETGKSCFFCWFDQEPEYDLVEEVELMTERKWLVYCTEAIDVDEWVFAANAEEAMEVIKENFYHLTPHYAEEIKPVPVVKYCMGHEYEEIEA